MLRTGKLHSEKKANTSQQTFELRLLQSDTTNISTRKTPAEVITTTLTLLDLLGQSCMDDTEHCRLLE